MTAGHYLNDHSFPCSQFVVDIERYSRIESGQRQAQVVKDLPDVLVKAARLAHLDRDTWRIQQRGDGEFSLIPVTVPKAQLVADYIRELVTELAFYNRWRNEDGRLRVRVALHHGEARIEQGNFPGNAPVVACRLVDSEPLKNALRAAPEAHLALILSDRMFEDTVSERERGLDPGNYTRFEIKQEKWEGIGWVTVPNFGAPALPRTEEPGSAVPPQGHPYVRQIAKDQSRVIGNAYGPTTMGDSFVSETDHFGSGGKADRRRAR